MSNPTKIIRVAIYARISTNGQSTEPQLLEVRDYAARKGWAVAGEFIKTGISGSRERRPELDRLWTECRRGRVDVVLVYRYGRFARSLRQLVNALEEFRALGIEFVSLHEGVDTSTPNGRLVFCIFASHRGIRKRANQGPRPQWTGCCPSQGQTDWPSACRCQRSPDCQSEGHRSLLAGHFEAGRHQCQDSPTTRWIVWQKPCRIAGAKLLIRGLRF